MFLFYVLQFAMCCFRLVVDKVDFSVILIFVVVVDMRNRIRIFCVRNISGRIFRVLCVWFGLVVVRRARDSGGDVIFPTLFSLAGRRVGL